MTVMHDFNPKPDSRPSLLTLVLVLGATAGYLLVWSVLGGPAGCGPQPGHSPAGRIFVVAPFVLPLAGVAILLALGVKRHWRGATLVGSAVTMVGMSGILEVLIFLLEFGAHHCGE